MAYRTFITTGRETKLVTGRVTTQEELIRQGKLPPSQIPGTSAFRKAQEKKAQEEKDKAMGIIFRETKGQKGYVLTEAGKRVPSYSKWQELQARKGRPAEFLSDFELYLRETGQFKEPTVKEEIKKEEKKAEVRQKIQELKAPTPFTTRAKTTKQQRQELAQAQLLTKAGLIPTAISEKGMPKKFVKRAEAEKMGLVSPAPFRSVLYDANNPDFLARETARLRKDLRQARQVEQELKNISSTKNIELSAIEGNKREFEKDLKAYEKSSQEAPRSIIRGAQGGFVVQLQSGEIVETNNINPFLKRQEQVAKDYDKLQAMQNTLNLQVDRYYSDPETLRLYQLQNNLDNFNIQTERLNKAVKRLPGEKKEVYNKRAATYTGARLPKIGVYEPSKEAQKIKAKEEKTFDEFLQNAISTAFVGVGALNPVQQAALQLSGQQQAAQQRAAAAYFGGAGIAERGLFGQPLPKQAPKGAAVLTAKQRRELGLQEEPLQTAIGRRAFRIGTVALPVSILTGGVGAIPSATLFTAGGAVAGEVTERGARRAGLTKPITIGPIQTTQAQVAGFAAEIAGGGLFAKAGAGAARAARAPITRRVTRGFQPTIEITKREPFMLLGPKKGRFATTAADIELKATLRRPSVKYPKGISGSVQKRYDAVRFAIAKRGFGGTQRISAENLTGKVELYELRELAPKFTKAQGKILTDRFGIKPFLAPEITPEFGAKLVRGIAEGKPRIAVVPKGMSPAELNFLKARGYTLVSAQEYKQIRNLLSTRKISVKGELKKAGLIRRGPIAAREKVKEELVIGARKPPRVKVTEGKKELRAEVDFYGRVSGEDYYGVFTQRLKTVRDKITGSLEKGTGRIESRIKLKRPEFERPVQVVAKSPFDLIRQRQMAYAKSIAPRAGPPSSRPLITPLSELIPEKVTKAQLEALVKRRIGFAKESVIDAKTRLKELQALKRQQGFKEPFFTKVDIKRAKNDISMARDNLMQTKQEAKELIKRRTKKIKEAPRKERMPEGGPIPGSAQQLGLGRGRAIQIQRARGKFAEEDVFLAQQGSAFSENIAAVRSFISRGKPRTRFGMLGGLLGAGRKAAVPSAKEITKQMTRPQPKLPQLTLPKIVLGTKPAQRQLDLTGFGFGDMGALRAAEAQRAKQLTAAPPITVPKTKEPPARGLAPPVGGIVRPFFPFGGPPGLGLKEGRENLRAGQLKYFNEISSALSLFTGRRAPRRKAQKRKPKRGKKK